MKLSYDPQADALYVRLLDGRYECRAVRLSAEVALNFGASEKLVGIEILNVKESLGSGRLPKVIVENLPVAGTWNPKRGTCLSRTTSR
jgi:uncharacterized protein YuzE